MKKIFLGILALGVFYVLTSFAFPEKMAQVGNKIGLSKFHEMIANLKSGVNETVETSDPFQRIQDAKQDALEVKQNFDNTILDKQQKLKDAAIHGDQMVDSAKQTKSSVDTTVQSLQDLKGSAEAVVELSGATLEQKQQQINDAFNKTKQAVKSVQDTKSSVDKTVNSAQEFRSSAQNVVGTGSANRANTK